MARVDQISRLGLDMDTAGLVRGAQAADRVAQSMDRAEREAQQLQDRTRRVGQQMTVLGGAAQALGTQLAAAFSIWAVIRANDAWVSATNQLRLVTDGARELRDMTQQVYDLSQRTASRFEAMTGLYASIQRAAGQAIGSQREVLRITETIAKFASASGGPEGSRSAALFQLRQMLQGAVVQAQEFNSLVDGTPLLVQAIADSLGVTRGELRRMVLDGRLATSQVIAALQEQADEADAIFSRVQFTVGDAMIRIQNAFQKLVGTNLGPIFSGVVQGLSFVAEHMDALIPVINGVAVALAIAFGPTLIVAFGAAIASLFALIAAHPIAALVGGIVAAASAIATFGDQIVLARHEITGFGEDLDETMQVTVTLADGFEAFFKVVGDKAGALWQSISSGAQSIGGAVMAKLREWLPDLQGWAQLAIQIASQIPRTIIGAFFGMVEALKEILSDVPGLLISAFQEGANGAISALEGLLNAAVEGINGLLGESGSALRLGAVEFGRIENDFAERGNRVAAAFQRGFTEGAEGFDAVFASVAGALGGFFDDVNMEAHNIALNRAMEERRTAAEAAEAAEQAAATAAGAGLDALAKQILARQELFDALEAQLRLNEREYEIYAETEDLLRQFPLFYAAAAAGAEDVAAAARAAAEADARRLDSLRRQIAAQTSLKQLAVEANRQQRLIDAAAQGSDALELEERTLDLLEEHAELYEGMGKNAEELARAEARRQIAAERTLDALTEQAERAEQIARAPVENLMEGLQGATDQFWDNFVENGFEAFDDLGDALKSVFRRLQADLLRAMFEPISQGLQNAVSGLFGGSKGAKGGGGFFGDVLGQIFGGAGGAGGGVMGQIGQVLGSIFGGGAGGGAGGAFGAGVLGYTISQALGLGSGTTGIGATLGGLAGSFFGGPIGSAIGSFLGDAIEGLFGGGVTSHMAAQRLSATGPTGAVWGVGGDDELIPETVQGVQDAARRVSEGQDLLRQLGGTLGSFVSYLSVSAEREVGRYALTNAATGVEGAHQRSATIGNPEELAQTALLAVLRDTDFADPVLDAVKDAMTGAGKSFEDTLKVLGSLQEVLGPIDDVTSEWEQALVKLNATFDDLRASTEGVAGAAEQVEAAFAQAQAALRDRFAASIEDAITGIENPVVLEFEQLMKVQAQRLVDANALGADVARVMHLNELELTGFIEKAGASAEAFEQLNQIFADLIARAQAAGQATAPLVQAYDQARAGVVQAFDKSIADQFGELTNPTLNALRQLLDAQKARLDQARAIGANIIAVERLNALEQKSFFEGLSDEQRASLGAYLGLVEDFTGRIAIVLGQLQDELGQRIDDTNRMRDDLVRQSEAMRTLAENLAQTRQGIVDRYGALSPRQGVDQLRERFEALADEARGGNDSALQALGQVGQQLIEASRALYGSTTTFRGDYDLVTQVLDEAENLAGQRADTLESQAATLLQQRDLLIEIRDILSDPDPQLEALAQKLGLLDVNQDIVANLLRTYLQLTNQQSQQNVSLSELVSGATAAAQTPSLGQTASNTAATTQTPATPTSQSGQTGNPVSPSSGGVTNTADAATAQMLAVQVDVLQNGFERLSESQDNTNRQIRILNERLAREA